MDTIGVIFLFWLCCETPLRARLLWLAYLRHRRQRVVLRVGRPPGQQGPPVRHSGTPNRERTVPCALPSP